LQNVLQLLDDITNNASVNVAIRAGGSGAIHSDVSAPQREIQDDAQEEHTQTADEKARNHMTLKFGTQTLTIQETMARQPIKDLHIQGCYHFINQLSESNLTTLHDLPQQLHGFHTRFRGVGPKTIEKFWDQLCEIDQPVQIEKHPSEQNVIHYE